jgi:hypothetical protein
MRPRYYLGCRAILWMKGWYLEAQRDEKGVWERNMQFALQLRKITEINGQGNRLVLQYLRWIGRLLRGSLYWPAEHQSPSLARGLLQWPLVGTSAFQVAEIRGSPHRLSSSHTSQSVLWCDRQRMETQNSCEFLCYQRTNVRYSQCEDTWVTTIEVVDMGAVSGPPHRAYAVHHRTDELLVELTAVIKLWSWPI